MSTEQVEKPDKLILPKPFFEKDSPERRDFKAVDTLSQTLKAIVYSGIFVGGMHFRRMLQHRKGSARPGQARYLALFELQPRQFVSIPLALGTYSFLSNSFYNLNEGKTTKGEVIASSAAVLVATIFKQGMALNKRVGLALGVGTAVGLFNWAGSFTDLYDSSYNYKKSTGQINNPESNKKLEASWEDGTYKKQGFWEVVYRKPLSETIADLGEGRGIGKA
ncbi:unnamed protein product [Ambrosiozyma monospora]|uniref:Unnamed protein product n=1 Tax=Ambrosiozyma monospora TaxID=43982 RepID=A0A9W6YY01_AMBMO|nr:unnamed protein product [Ambrosiozyma monospora]